MKVGRDADAFLRAVDPRIAAILLYGPDAGLVRERADAVTAEIAGNASDPFRVSDLQSSTLREDPPRLADEAAALPMMGGRRVVRVRDAVDSLAGLLEGFLAGTTLPAMVVLEAGELRSRSPLRRLFEEAGNAAAIACYRDEGNALGRFVRDELGRGGVALEPDAQAFLEANLGSDRAITRSEIEKLLLYAEGTGLERLGLEDVRRSVGDSAWLELDDLAFALGEGDLPQLDRCIERSLSEGVSPVRLLRVAAQHMARLHLVAGLIARGRQPEQALAALRPPLFGRDRERLGRQAKRWSRASLGRALEQLVAAELACKQTGAADREICHETLMAIATEVAGRKRRLQ